MTNKKLVRSYARMWPRMEMQGQTGGVQPFPPEFPVPEFPSQSSSEQDDPNNQEGCQGNYICTVCNLRG